MTHYSTPDTMTETGPFLRNKCCYIATTKRNTTPTISGHYTHKPQSFTSSLQLPRTHSAVHASNGFPDNLGDSWCNNSKRKHQCSVRETAYFFPGAVHPVKYIFLQPDMVYLLLLQPSQRIGLIAYCVSAPACQLNGQEAGFASHVSFLLLYLTFKFIPDVFLLLLLSTQLVFLKTFFVVWLGLVGLRFSIRVSVTV